MTGAPSRRSRREAAGQAVAPRWRDHPELSTREAFQPNNEAALKHGATSARRVAPLAAERAERLPAVAPWTARDAFEGTRADLCWVEGQIDLLRAYIDEHGTLDAEGRPIPAQALHDRLVGRAQTLRVELGLTPQSLGKLLVSLASVAVAGGDAHGLDALKREGAEIVAARALSAVPDGGAA
jgi:hypothetical protein